MHDDGPGLKTDEGGLTPPPVDVVIPTHDRHARLVRTLQSLTRQTCQDFAVLIVDDGSTPPVEGTLPAGLLERVRGRVLRAGANEGPAGARNRGILASRAACIAFLDDDVDADPFWLEALRRAGGTRGVAVIGPLLAPPDWRPTPWNAWEARTLAREYGRMAQGDYTPTWRQFFTGNALVHREDLLAAGLFDPSLRRAEDIELGIRLTRARCRFVFAPDAKGWHYARRTCRAWRATAEQYAIADAAIARRHPTLPWARIVAEERDRRARALQLAKRLLRTAGAQEAVARAGPAVALAASRLRLPGAAHAALSLTYELDYERSWRRVSAQIERRAVRQAV